MSNERIIVIRISEPEIQFYSGMHISPRKILSLKPFSYKDLLNEEIHVKLLTDEETHNLGVKLINHIIKGYSFLNKNMPSFNDSFGVKLIFHENSDVKKISSENLLFDLEDTLNTLKSEDTKGIVIIALKDLSDDVYINSKIKIMSSYSKLNLRSQLIKKRTIESHMDNGSYAYLLMNIATAIYAKVGGIPWKLSRNVLSTKGLILGISFSKKRDKISDKEVIYYGAIQLLDKYGEHLYTEAKMFVASPKELSTKGLFIPSDKLKSILINAIKQYGKIPQIVIHKSAPIVNEEVEAIKEVIEEYGSDNYPIFYIFTHIKSNTIYRAYDPSASDYSIQRGLMLLRSSRSSARSQYIIFTTGRLYKITSERDKLGTPKPLELTIDTNMPRLIPSYIGEQVFALTKLDWNTTDPEVREPITIKYSRKAAQIAPKVLNANTPDLKIIDIRDLM